MGEILRAVLDATCIYSAPAYYTGSVAFNSANTGSRTFAMRNTVIQCKSDTWFLMMGWSFQSCAALAGNSQWSNKAESQVFNVTNLKMGKQLQFNDVEQDLANYNLNNFVTLPEYTLWEPSDLIGINMTVAITDIAARINTSFLTLAGIEYLMPEGKGFSNGRS